MGICSSCESTAIATTKLILEDGDLQEFNYPVRVSYVLQKHPYSFICNSDEIDFNDFVSAISDNEELQPGQLYFIFPLSKLKKRLQAEEIAALAVKANLALTKSSNGGCGNKNPKCKCRRKSVAPVGFSVTGYDDQVKSATRRTDGGNEVRVAEKKRRSSGGRGRNFASNLGAIPE